VIEKRFCPSFGFNFTQKPFAHLVKISLNFSAFLCAICIWRSHRQSFDLSLAIHLSKSCDSHNPEQQQTGKQKYIEPPRDKQLIPQNVIKQ